jgi:iron complex transport system substrate-binding protein
VGISAECDAPAAVMDRPRVSLAAMETGGTDPAGVDAAVRDRLARGEPLFRADHAALRRLRPTLILSQSLCDVCAATPGSLSADTIGDATVLALDGRDLDGLLEDIHRVAAAAGRPGHGRRLAASLSARREAITRRPDPPSRVLAVEWPDPLFVGGHWVPHMITAAGGEPFNAPGDHSVVVDWDAVRAFAPTHIVIMPCGESLTGATDALASLQRRPGWDALPAVRDDAVYLVDGNRFFSRPGPAAFTGLEIMAAILGTGTVADPAPGFWQRAGVPA